MSVPRKLYRLHVAREGEFYVVAAHSTAAVDALRGIIAVDGRECRVERIDIICDEIRIEDKPFHLNTGRQLLVMP